jgi:beta-lactam-binding protein with PASTA domain
MIVARGLDLIAALLANRTGLRGIVYWAVGSGDPAWDAAPPTIDPATTGLKAEIYRKRIDPTQATYDSSSRTITVSVTFGPGEAIGMLREFGLFGGDASPRPGSGFLINYTIHAPLQHAAGTSLARQVHFNISSATLLNSAADLIGGLLIGQPGLAGAQYWALGGGDPAWDTTLPGRDPKTAKLVNEVLRKPVDSDFDLSYSRTAHVLDAHTVFSYDQAAAALRETALFGGNATADANTGILLSYQPHAGLDKTTPQALAQELRIVLGSGANVTVPNVVGMTPDAAVAAIQAANLLRGQSTTQENDAQAGKVISQNPAAGATVAQGSLVDIVSGVHTRVVVPNLTGLTLASADTVLANAGLTRAAETPPAEQSLAPAGTILRQTPAPGTRADSGSAVHVVVATAVTTTVPDLTGHTAGEAAILLAAAQLQLAAGPPARQASAQPDGTILSQNPAAGTSAPIHSTVAITIAAPPSIEVPDLTGMLPDAAAAALRQAAAAVLTGLGRPQQPPGLSLGAQTSSENAAAAGTIIGQTPAPHAQAWLYSAVQIVVAAPFSAQAPNLIGLTQTAAAAALTAANLALDSVSSRQDVATAGTVVSQDPAAGVRLARGSTVAITLAQPILVTVPDTVGHGEDYAKEVVNAQGLVLGTPTQTPSSQPDGTVLSQNPAAGTQVARGSTVNITVATKVVVPSVVGDTVAAATTALAAVQLVLAQGAQTISDQPEGTVLTQSPASGARVPPGATVTVTTAIGVTIPAVTGQLLAQATATLTGLGLRIAATAQTVSAQPETTVLTQNPAAGQRLPLGGTVQVTTATGVVVPSVIGQTSDQATTALRALGLAMTVTGQTVSSQPAGTVLTQNPAAGQKLPLGGTVQVTTATGVQVPLVIGQTQSAATGTLSAIGLRLAVTATTPSTQPPGTVLTQNPAAGQMLPLGGTVQVTVAGLVTVPSVVGMTTAQATQLLEPLSLKLVIGGSVANSAPAGTILSQSPVANTQVQPGSTVTVQTSLGPHVTVPNIVGMQQAQGQTALSQANLQMNVTDHVTDSRPAGVIVSQNPAAGASVAQGSTVNVVTSSGPAQNVAVPNIVGQTVASATTLLGASGLQIATTTIRSTAPAGTIVSQSPTAGTQVARGSTVQASVSTGIVIP